MLVWSRKWWAKAWSGDGRERAFKVALCLIVLLGLYLRVNGWLGQRVSFWYDEATWATRLLHWPLPKLGIRPIGFMWVTRLLVQTFGVTEVWFRALPALGGIGALVLMPWVVSRLVASRLLRLLVVLLFAMQPALIDYCNEFKPYSLEVLTHLVPIALYLRFDQTGKRAWFYALLGYLPLAFLFSYNLAFAFPGLLSLCLFRAWHAPDRRRLLTATLLGGVACAAICAGIYRYSLSKVTREGETEAYWGDKYHVFYRDDGEESRFAWTLRKYNDMTALIGLRRTRWAESGKLSEPAARELGSLDRAFWIGLSFVGLYALWQKRRDLLLVLFAPLLVMVIVNLLGKWPLGAFRTNLFTQVYTLSLIAVGMQLLTPTRRRLAALCTAAFMLSVLPGFWLAFDWQDRKQTFTRAHRQREILATLYAHRRRQLARDPGADPLPLYMDPHSYVPYTFYVREHSVLKKRYAEFFAKHFVAKKVSSGSLTQSLKKRLRKDKNGMWSVASARLGKIERASERTGSVVIKEHIADQHLVLFMQESTTSKEKSKRKRRNR
jgi:hypothetical protein